MKYKTPSTLCLFALIASTWSCGPADTTNSASVTGQTTSALRGREQRTLDVFNQHVAAFNSGDINAIMADFDHRSIVITPAGVFDDLAGIQSVFEGLLAEFGTVDNGDSPGINVTTFHLRKDTVFIDWNATGQNLFFPYGSDTFIIKGRKIRRQTIAFTTPQPLAP